MVFHWVGHSKTKPIEIDELFKINIFNCKLNSNLNINELTDAQVVAENITE